MNIYFTSDTHFQHTNIIQYSGRPYSSVVEMDAALINNWNSRVMPDDLVYHVGDFAMGNRNKVPELRRRLNGQIILIKGNHDYKKPGILYPAIIEAEFSGLYDELIVDVDDIKLYLRHEPDMKFTASDKAQYHLHGHVHRSWSRKGNIINVGVDVHGYKPVTLQELIDSKEIMGPSHREY